MTARPIKRIVPGDRVRDDLGDIAGLMESIREQGLIQPIVVDSRDNLLAGARRLEACKRLGWNQVDVVVMYMKDDLLKALAIEEQENTCRKAFTPTEAAKLRKRRAALLAAMAKERQREHGKTAPGRPTNTRSKLEQVSPAKTRAAAAVGTGFSATTLDKVDEIVRTAADDTQPEPVREVAQQAVAEINATGKVDRAHQKVAKAKVEHDPIKKSLDALLDQPEGRILTLRLNVSKGMLRTRETLLVWSPESVAEALTEERMEDLARLVADLDGWFQKVRAARPRGLRVVGGS